MRILHVEDEIWDSGIAHYALTLAREQKRRGHEVYFCGTEGSHLSLKAREAALEVKDIRRPWMALRELRRYLRQKGIQIINAHTGSAHSLAAAVSAGLGIPVVRTRGDARAPRGNHLTRALSHRTAAYIAANSRIREQLAEAFPQARVETIFQGMEAPAEVPPLPEELLVGVLGRLDPVKGHEDFIVAAKEVVRSFPQARFLIAGSGDPERLERLKAWAGRLGLSEKVEFLGFVPDAGAFIGRCRVGVVASVESEAVSRAALEWMAHGRPLIATKVGCLPDLIEDEASGFLVPAGHPGQIALALKQLFKNPGLAGRTGESARARFLSRFGLERFCETTERLYEEVLRRLPSRR